MPQTTVIVGASRGIGLELVKQAAARGDRVIATVRRESDKAAPMEAGAARALLVDVTEPATLKAAAAKLDDAVDLLICNAGVLNSYGGIQDSSHDRWAWQTVLMTNVAGPYFTVRAFLPLLERSKSAKVAILTSAMGAQLNAQGNAYPYRASKAGATNVARNLAVELASRKIAVGAYHPGWVRTDMGGEAADVPVEDAVEGLLLRLQALSPETTGVIEDYKGNPIPF